MARNGPQGVAPAPGSATASAPHLRERTQRERRPRLSAETEAHGVISHQQTTPLGGWCSGASLVQVWRCLETLQVLRESRDLVGARRGRSRETVARQRAAQMPLADRPAPQILQLTLTPTSGSSLATKIALHIGPASGSTVPAVATDALTLRVVASGPSSVAAVFGEPPKTPLQAKASPAGAAPPPRGHTSLFEGFLAFLGLQSCFQ